MKMAFRERNPVPIAITAFAVIVAMMLTALNLDSIPFLGGGEQHTAAFAEAAGLRKGEEVRIAGVKVGKVTGLDLEDDHVKVTFRVDKGVRLGNRTGAEIKIKTLLGQHYLALVPRGSGKLDRQIPVSATRTPFEVVPAISQLSQRIEKINVQEVAKSFDVLSDTFRNSPEEVRASLQGLRRLSRTVSSRDEQLHELAGRAKDVTRLLADRNQDFSKLIQDGDKILQAVQARRAVIHQLLVNTVVLSQQVNALIAENQDELRPMLANLQRVNRILLANQANLDRTIELFAPFARQFTDATGTGRWFDSFIQNLVPIPASIQGPGGGSGSGKQKGNQQENQPGTGQPRTDNPLPFLP